MRLVAAPLVSGCYSAARIAASRQAVFDNMDASTRHSPYLETVYSDAVCEMTRVDSDFPSEPTLADFGESDRDSAGIEHPAPVATALSHHLLGPMKGSTMLAT
ncbi:MAG TPA: hypothetical protein EYQ46_22490 [Myxococcales bacterium]|nr:hypothetical protein [Myxococcales bacterium]HIL81012.1 hypothetical protein [Myxococcales bacterium]